MGGADLWMSSGKVALNISVCRSSLDGIPGEPTSRRMSGSKPMSNMRSASSRTRWRTLLRPTWRRALWGGASSGRTSGGTGAHLSSADHVQQASRSPAQHVAALLDLPHLVAGVHASVDHHGPHAGPAKTPHGSMPAPLQFSPAPLPAPLTQRRTSGPPGKSG